MNTTKPYKLVASGHTVLGFICKEDEWHIVSVTYEMSITGLMIRAYVNGILVKTFEKFSQNDKIIFKQFTWDIPKYFTIDEFISMIQENTYITQCN